MTYTENQSYLNSNQIFATKQTGKDFYLEIGEYSFPFEFILPADLPSSFEHKTGKIRYTLKGTIDIPWSFNKHTIKMFTVLSETDLNRFQLNLHSPLVVKDFKSVLFSFGGPIEAIFTINKGGFVLGEKIVCSASINNKSSRNVTKTSLKLIQEVSFTGSVRELFVKNTKIKKVRADVVNLVFNKIIAEKTSESVFEKYAIEIPRVCPSSNGLCKIIEVNYFVVFEFGVFGSLDKDLLIPIKIGSIPLEEEGRATNCLPTYEECMFNDAFGDTHLEKTNYETFDSNEKTYKPIYPYFKDYSFK